MVTGVILVAISVLTGEARVAIVIIIPVIYGAGVLMLGGILCVIAGFFLMFYSGSMGGPQNDEETTGQATAERKVGGVLMIGPIPIIFGSDKKTALIAAAIALIVMALTLLLLL